MQARLVKREFDTPILYYITGAMTYSYSFLPIPACLKIALAVW